jgi:hypothetical protein
MKSVLLPLCYRDDANSFSLQMANADFVKRESGKLLGRKEGQIALNLCNFVNSRRQGKK